jgi:peptidoglycan hydrolase CwlO-like protein
MKRYIGVLVLVIGVTFSYAQQTLNNAELNEMMGKLQNRISSNPNMSEEDKQKAFMAIMNKSNSAQSMLEKQKQKMPKTLKVLKHDRACLAKADTTADMKKCEESSKKFAKKLGIYDNEYYEDDGEEIIWNEKEKKETLRGMDGAINRMEKMLPCIQNAKVMSDMMECSKGMR